MIKKLIKLTVLEALRPKSIVQAPARAPQQVAEPCGRKYHISREEAEKGCDLLGRTESLVRE